MSLIPERVWTLLTDEERAQVEEIVDGWRYSPVVDCPQCGVKLGIKLRISAGAVFLDQQERTPAAPKAVGAWEADLDADELRILDEAEQTGLFAAFRTAVVEEKGVEAAPKDMRRFMLTFLRSAREKQMPRFVLDRFKDEFPNVYLKFYSGQGVIAVSSDGAIRSFVPMRFVGIGDSGKKPSVPGGLRTNFPREERLEQWVRGRFGYVPVGAKQFGEALHQRNTGSFGRLVQ